MSHATRPTVVDLFCGAGGLSEGFRAAGYDIRAGFDHTAPAADTFASRFGAETAERLKVQDLAGDRLEAWKERIGPLDVLVGGPSCQGYSTSGGLTKASGRDKYDPRNSLFREYVRLVRELQPNWLLFENVPGLLLYNQGAVAREILEMLAPEYQVRPLILLAADFGVPQLRRRLFFVGNKTGQPIVFPRPTHGDPTLWKSYALPFKHLSRVGHSGGDGVAEHVGFDEACSDLPALDEGATLDGVPYGTAPRTPYQERMRRRSGLLHQHQSFTLCETDRYAAQHLQPGQNWRHIPSEHRPARFDRIRPYDATTLMKRLLPDKPAYTITTKFNEASTGAFIHPHQPRTLSVREAARLQSFPDDFLFVGSGAQRRRLIGNAVPPLLAEAMAEAILPGVLADRGVADVAPTRETIDVTDIALGDIIGLTGARRRTKDYDARQAVLFP